MRIILARLKSREPNLARNWLKVLFVTLLDILADVLLVTLEPVKLWCKDLKVQKERPEFMSFPGGKKWTTNERSEQETYSLGMQISIIVTIFIIDNVVCVWKYFWFWYTRFRSCKESYWNPFWRRNKLLYNKLSVNWRVLKISLKCFLQGQ